MSQACNLCGKSATNRCASCGHVVYCCREHQKQDWKSHKYACKEFGSLKKQGQTWEADVREGVYNTAASSGQSCPYGGRCFTLVPWWRCATAHGRS